MRDQRKEPDGGLLFECTRCSAPAPAAIDECGEVYCPRCLPKRDAERALEHHLGAMLREVMADARSIDLDSEWLGCIVECAVKEICDEENELDEDELVEDQHEDVEIAAREGVIDCLDYWAAVLPASSVIRPYYVRARNGLARGMESR